MINNFVQTKRYISDVAEVGSLEAFVLETLDDRPPQDNLCRLSVFIAVVKMPGNGFRGQMKRPLPPSIDVRSVCESHPCKNASHISLFLAPLPRINIISSIVLDGAHITCDRWIIFFIW